MKKQVLALVMVLVMLMGVAAQATGPMRAPSVKPELSFQGTTALCSALVRGNTTKRQSCRYRKTLARLYLPRNLDQERNQLCPRERECPC